MNKYTVLLNFEDRTMWIWQFFAKDPEASLMLFIKESESLMNYDRERIIQILKNIEKKLIKIDWNMEWIWLMNFWTTFLTSDDFSSIYWWYIILSK